MSSRLLPRRLKWLNVVNTEAKALYVHIPFCDHICFYCGFCKQLYQAKVADQYLAVIGSQINALNDGLDTIYIGGGTPSALSIEQLTSLLSLLQTKMVPQGEFTIEMNPESCTPQKVALLKAFGINRISLGIQCTQDSLLAAIGRRHTFAQVQDAYELLRRQGMANISVDLMYGLPKQTLADLNESLDLILAMKPDHLSLYSLTIEANSVFGKQHIREVESDLETAMYVLICKRLQAAGYEHYEIANFAQPGKRSRHNQVYWHYQPFHAVGAGASGMRLHYRYSYTDSIADFIAHQTLAETLNLSRRDEEFEMLMMGLRLREGISMQDFEQRFAETVRDCYPKALATNIKKGLLIEEGDRLLATDAGFMMLNEVLVYFLEEV